MKIDVPAVLGAQSGGRAAVLPGARPRTYDHDRTDQKVMEGPLTGSERGHDESHAPHETGQAASKVTLDGPAGPDSPAF